ncbi:hypothetical protein LSH36_1279g00003 [Paralvinella palmiformis]|uniref:Uncharacterized protein n=1 Tax=Paralvinella palmiformis TaxID=53620 RepID=A0AAD9ITI6_9ANNE|nr:hypothetical protein LSH36_1279g00003 [Paralvinella palmiformis]
MKWKVAENDNKVRTEDGLILFTYIITTLATVVAIALNDQCLSNYCNTQNPQKAVRSFSTYQLKIITIVHRCPTKVDVQTKRCSSTSITIIVIHFFDLNPDKPDFVIVADAHDDDDDDDGTVAKIAG